MNKNSNPQLHIGETKMMNCGLEATIIAYKNYENITVQFSNGVVRENKTYGNFKKGTIGTKDLQYSYDRTGEQNVMQN